jgi:branched-chain amino acid transport system substrate-binding protein
VQESAPARPPDFTPIIAKMKAANPDLVYCSGFVGFCVALVKQALEQGLNAREFHVIHHGSAFRKAVGETQANHVTGENYWMPGIKKGNWQMFEEMLQKTGITVADYPWAGIRMFGLDALKATLEKAGSLDREKLLAAARAVDVETISGRLRVQGKGASATPNAEHQGTMNPFPTQIQDGKYVTLWPPEIATGKHIYPRSGAR